jgi:nucleoside-diphosphate-sugar epimerase
MTTHGSERAGKVFVAGATGVVGSRAVRQLLAAGHEVTALARSPEKAAALLAVGATPVQVDLFDASALMHAIAGHDAVCNLATHIPRTSKAALPGAWKQNDRIRTEGSRNLVDAALAAGAAHYVQESISFVYADAGDAWIDETSEITVVPYVQSALESLAQTERFTAGGGSGVLLRFGMFYAPDSHHTVDLFSMARKGISTEIGELDAYKTTIHADDAASAVVAALGLPGGVFNVGEDEPLTRRDHLEIVAGLVGRKKLRRAAHHARHLAGSKTEMLARSQRVSNRTFREATGWAPRYPSIREGYPEVVAQIGASS